ncbi:reverse transcriptase domain-containing protein [Tanacetum coccineum]
MFLGYAINRDEIQACSEKTQAMINMSSPQTLKEVQRLNGNLANLNRFQSKAVEKSLSFFKTLKRCIKKSNFVWTKEAKKELKEMKEKMVVLQSPEVNYTPMEKLILDLVHVAKRLRRYFQAHPVAIITHQPIRQILSKTEKLGRLAKWAIELGEHAITYRPRTSIKGKALANFLVEFTAEQASQNEETATAGHEVKELWKLFTDGSSNKGGSGVGLILTSLDEVEFTYALRFEFKASNNEDEYEALLVGLRITESIGVKHVEAFVLVEVLSCKLIEEIEVNGGSKRSWQHMDDADKRVLRERNAPRRKRKGMVVKSKSKAICAFGRDFISEVILRTMVKMRWARTGQLRDLGDT